MTVVRLAMWLVLIVLGVAALGHAITPDAARARVDHHLRHVERLRGHFETVLAGPCPTFPSPAAWDAYLEREMEQLALLIAHLEQAWVEAKRSDDDDVRRTAKAPRRQREQGRQLVDKLAACAEMNGAAFAPLALWRRVERDVAARRIDVALPQ